MTNSLQLYRTLPLNDSENTQLFTFKLGLLNLDEFKSRSVRSTIINYQGQDWYLSCKYAEGKRHEFLGVYIYWGSPAEGVRCRADFRIITRNVLDPTKSLVTEGSQVEFSAPQSPGWGKREFAPLRELFTPGQGFLLEPEKIVIIELAMKSCSTLFEQSVDFAQLLNHREQPYPSFFTANFSLAGMEFYVSLYPLGDREEAEGHVSMYLHRFLGNENEATHLGCRIRFRFFLGHSRTCPTSSKTFEFSFKNEQGYGRFKAFEPLNGSDNLLYRGAVPLGVEIVSVTPFAQPEIRLTTRGYYHTDNFVFEDATFPDHRGNMWRLSASGGAQTLSLRLNTEDKNRLFAAQGLVPSQARLAKREECTKFLQWRAFVLSRTDRKKTLAVNGCPLSAYYSRGLAQTSFNMSTQIPLSKAKALDGDYCTKEEPSLLVRIEFLNVQDLGMMSDYPTLDFERFQLYHTREGLKRCLKQNELLVKELESLHGRLSAAMKENRDSKDLVTDFQKLLKIDKPPYGSSSNPPPLPSPTISSSLPSPPPPPPLSDPDPDQTRDQEIDHDHPIPDQPTPDLPIPVQPIPRFPPKRDNFQLMKWLLQQSAYDPEQQDKNDNMNGDAKKLLPAQTPTSRPASISSSPTLNAQPPVPRPRGQRGPPPRPPPRAYSPVVTDLVNTKQFTYNAPTPTTSAGAPAPSPGSPSPTMATPPPSHLPGTTPAPSHQGPPPASSTGLGMASDQHRLAVLNSNDTAFKRFSFTGINITAAMISKETSETSKKVHEDVPAQSSSGGKEPESPLRQQKQQQQPPPRPLLPPQGQPTQQQIEQHRELQQHKQHLLQQQKELQEQLQQQKQNLQNGQQQHKQQMVHPQENGKSPGGSQASPVVMSKMGNDGTARGFALARMTRPPVSTSTSLPRTNPQSPSPQSPTPSPSPEDTSNHLSWPQGLSVQTPQTSQSTGALNEGVKSSNAQHTKQDPPKLSNGDIGTKPFGLSNGFQSNLQQAASSPNIASSNSGSQSKEPGSSPKRRPLTSPTHRPTSSPPEIPSGFSFSPVPESVLNRKSPVPEPVTPQTRSSQVSASANQQGQQGHRNPSWPMSLPLPQNSLSQSSDSSLNQASIPGSVVSRDPASQQNAVREETARHAKSTPNTPNRTSRPVSESASVSTPTSPTRQNGLPNGHRQQNGSPLHLPPPPQPPQLPPPLKPTRLPEPLKPSQVPQLPPPPPPPLPPTSHINGTQQELIKINGGVTTSSQVDPTQKNGIRTPASPVPDERVTSPTKHLQQQQFQEQFNKLHQQQLKHLQQHHHHPHQQQQEEITKTATGNGAVINNNNMTTILDKTYQHPGQDALLTNGTNGKNNGNNGVNGANGTYGVDRTDNGRTPTSPSSVSSPPTSPPPVTVVRRKQQNHSDRMEDLSKRLSIPSVEERQRMGIIETSL